MSSGMYKIGEEGLLGAINLSTDVIKARLVTGSYTPNLTTDTSLTNVGAGVGTDQTLASISVTAGVFNAANSTWTAVAAGSTLVAAVIYKFVTNDAGSTPIAYIQFTNSTTTNGGDITIPWTNSANKIFTLS